MKLGKADETVDAQFDAELARYNTQKAEMKQLMRACTAFQKTLRGTSIFD